MIKGREGCPYCGSWKLYRHGKSREREVLHTWSNGRKVFVRLKRGRWKCCECGRTFSEGRELVRPYCRLTKQAESEALWRLKERDFSFRHQDLVYTVTEVKKRKMIGILKDDRIATLKEFLREDRARGSSKKVRIPKKIFLVGRERLSEEIR